MGTQNYFDKKLVGGAINQRGINYQIYVCIKYIFDFLDDADFMAISVEQYDDFAIVKKNEIILCQVKSICYDMKDVRKFLNGNYNSRVKQKNLICSAFSNEVHGLIEKRRWFEYRIKNNWLHDEESILKDYKKEIEKYVIDYDKFNSTKLDTIPCDYAETISINSVMKWAQKNNIAINADKLIEALYHEISVLGSSRGLLYKNRVYEIINRCMDRENAISTSLDIMENEDIFNEHHIPQERWLYYIQESKDNMYSIIPKLQYWENIIFNNKPMSPIFFYWEPFKWELPNLDIKVLNNSDNTLFITEIIMEISSSILNSSPLIFIRGHGTDTNARHLDLNNDGWGKIKNLKIKINCNTIFNEKFDEFSAEEYIGDIEAEKNIDISNMLYNITKINFEDFDSAFEELKKSVKCYSEYEIRREELFDRYFGEYKSGKVYVNGLLDFEANAIEENDRHYTLKFSSWIYLYQDFWPALPAPPSYQYDIELPVQGNNYIVKKTISQVLKSGEADRFDLKIHCTKSSNHIMDIYLKDINGNKIEVKKNVHLNICIPRSGSRYIETDDIFQHSSKDFYSGDLNSIASVLFEDDEWL